MDHRLSWEIGCRTPSQ